MKLHGIRSKAIFISIALLLTACGGSDSVVPTSTIGDSDPTVNASNTPEASSTALQTTAVPTNAATPEDESGSAASLIIPFPIPTRGTGAIHDADGDGLLSWDEYNLAVADMIAVFPWPPTFNVTPEFVLSFWPDDSRSALFQVGFERDNVGVFWECAWLITWLETRNGVNPELEAQAQEFIVNSMPDMVDDDYSRNVPLARAEQVLLGDPAGVINSINVNCSTIDFERTNSTAP